MLLGASGLLQEARGKGVGMGAGVGSSRDVG